MKHMAYYPMPTPMYRRGLGSQQNAQAGVQFGAAGVSAAVSGAIAAGLIPTAAIPFIGPALAGVALVASLLIKNSGCGQTCIQTSQWANQAATALQQNLDAYNALPVPRHVANQQLALQTFDSIWAKLVQMCGDPQWGNAGKRCITDRQRGACTWKNNGQCWDWFIGYRDPIANDPNVTSDSSLASMLPASVSSLFSGGSLPAWALPVAALALLAVAA
jgi:hypothetical protein